jgi:hypothetical protein
VFRSFFLLTGVSAALLQGAAFPCAAQVSLQREDNAARLIVDGQQHTVVLVQVENEVGIKPEMRDLSDRANPAFAGPVPKPLMEYLAAHNEELHPVLLERWGRSDFATRGSWSEVFGGSPGADEVFSAWHGR